MLKTKKAAEDTVAFSCQFLLCTLLPATVRPLCLSSLSTCYCSQALLIFSAYQLLLACSLWHAVSSVYLLSDITVPHTGSPTHRLPRHAVRSTTASRFAFPLQRPIHLCPTKSATTASSATPATAPSAACSHTPPVSPHDTQPNPQGKSAPAAPP